MDKNIYTLKVSINTTVRDEKGNRVEVNSGDTFTTSERQAKEYLRTYPKYFEQESVDVQTVEERKSKIVFVGAKPFSIDDKEGIEKAREELETQGTPAEAEGGEIWKEKGIEDFNLKELKALAEEKGMEIPKNKKSKAEVLDFIKSEFERIEAEGGDESKGNGEDENKGGDASQEQ